MWPKSITKAEAHKIIDEIQNEEIFILTYEKEVGISDCGKRIGKKKGKTLINQADTIILISDTSVGQLNLEGDFNILPHIKRRNMIKSILFPRLE